MIKQENAVLSKMKKAYSRGLIIKLKLKNEPNAEDELYILSLVFDDKFIFQMIRLTGYYAGDSYGYIEEDPYCEERRLKGVTKEHLAAQIEKYAGPYYKNSFKIYKKLEYKDIQHVLRTKSKK